MGLFDGVVGGFIGGELASVVNQVIQQQGGLSGLVSKFQQGGLGETVQSWIGTGANAPVSGAQLHSVLGSDLVQQLAAKTGMSQEDLLHKLSQVLPTVVDTMTPGGAIPKA
jgi:uncharacterized protein YidB (DUF937 family)